MRRTVALAQRGDRTLARPARALADQLVTRHASAVGDRGRGGHPPDPGRVPENSQRTG